MRWRVSWLGILGVATFASGAAGGQSGSIGGGGVTNSATTELIGQAVRDHSRMVFQTSSGAVYQLVSNKVTSAIFNDTNLHARTLILKGHVADGGRFEMTGNLRSLRNGITNDLYYYCDVCSIKQIDPGPCMCCREPVELREEPVKK